MWERNIYLFVHFTSWLIYSTYRHYHGYDSEPQAKCPSSASLPIFMLVFTFFKSGPRRQTLSPIDVQVTCPLRAIWPTEWHTFPLNAGSPRLAGTPINAPVTEHSTTSLLTRTIYLQNRGRSVCRVLCEKLANRKWQRCLPDKWVVNATSLHTRDSSLLHIY